MRLVFSVVANVGRLTLLSSSILAALFCAPAAQAQWDPGATLDLGTGYGQTALSQSILSGTRHLGSKSGVGKSKAHELRFYWRDYLSRQFQQEVIEKGGGNQPERQKKVAALFKDLNPTASFQELVHKNGLDMFSIPDLITMYCVAEWEIVTGRQASREGVHRLRDQIRDSILQQQSVFAKIRSFDQQAKQYWLETLAYKAILSRMSYDQKKKQGNNNEIEQLRSTIIKDVKTLGMDIQNLEL